MDLMEAKYLSEISALTCRICELEKFRNLSISLEGATFTKINLLFLNHNHGDCATAFSRKRAATESKVDRDNRTK